MARRSHRKLFSIVLLLLLLPAVHGLAADLDGDGAEDLVFRDDAAEGKGLRIIGAGQIRRLDLTAPAELGQGIDVRTGNFARSSRDNLLTRNLLTGETRVWRLEEDGSFLSQSLQGLPTAPAKLIEAVVDFDGDGRDDILLRDRNTGVRAVYRLRGAAVDPLHSGMLGIDTGAALQLVAAADFDGDGRADLLLRNTSTLAWVMHLLDGPTVRATLEPALPLNPVWVLQGTADMDRDGRLDLLFRRLDTGEWRLWFMSGAQPRAISGTVALPADPAWRLALLDDLDGDGNGDALLQHSQTRELYAAYLIQRGVRTGSGRVALVPDPAQRVAGAGDFNGDGAREALLTVAGDAWVVADLSRPGSPRSWPLETGAADELALACPPPLYADFRLPPPADPVGPDAALLTWSRPATRTNGEALCAHDLAGFRISAWRQGSTAYRDITVPDGAQRQRLVADLTPGVWRFGVQAYDGQGRAGPFSEIRTKTIRRPPSGP